MLLARRRVRRPDATGRFQLLRAHPFPLRRHERQQPGRRWSRMRRAGLHPVSRTISLASGLHSCKRCCGQAAERHALAAQGVLRVRDLHGPPGGHAAGQARGARARGRHGCGPHRGPRLAGESIFSSWFWRCSPCSFFVLAPHDLWTSLPFGAAQAVLDEFQDLSDRWLFFAHS